MAVVFDNMDFDVQLLNWYRCHDTSRQSVFILLDMFDYNAFDKFINAHIPLFGTHPSSQMII